MLTCHVNRILAYTVLCISELVDMLVLLHLNKHKEYKLTGKISETTS